MGLEKLKVRYSELKQSRWHDQKISWSAYLFILPFFIPFLTMTVGSVFFGAYVAFTKWGIVGSPKWVGLQNFQDVFADEQVRIAFTNTFIYILLIVPSVVVLGLIFAVFVNQRWPGYVFARTAFYVPNVVSATVIGLVWVWMLDTKYGVINQYLGIGIPWLTSPDWALFGVSLASIWWDTGLAFVLFLAALQEVDNEQKEAAALDGAGPLQVFLYVIIPNIRPTISMVITLQIITTMRIFSQVLVMTDGGPASASLSVIYYIYRFGIAHNHLGFASALSLLLFFLILIITVVQFRFIRERD